MLEIYLLVVVGILCGGVDSQSWVQHDGKDCYDGKGAVAMRPDPYSNYVTLSQCKSACLQSSGCEGIVRKRADGANAGICYLRKSISLDRCAGDYTWTLYQVSGGAAASNGWTKYGGLDCYQGRGGNPIQPDPHSNAMSLSACKAACQRNSQCGGIIRKASDRQGNGICYLRKNLNVNYCARDATWDLYYKGSGSNSGPIVPVRPVVPAVPAGPDQIVNKMIAENKVMIFSKTTCPYCVEVKNLLSRLNIRYNVIEIDRRSDGNALFQALLRKTGQRTVPNIFINGNHIGGVDHVKYLYAQNRLLSLIRG